VRWAQEIDGSGWDYGVPLGELKELVEYWRAGYDWRAWESRINSLPQFTTTIDHQLIHFLHIRSGDESALPLILTLMPPRAGVPYPPYFPPFITHVAKLLKPDELLCTDMPWATAWYGRRNSLLLPATIDDFYEINDYNKRISGLYFTTITRNKAYVKDLLTGPERSWFPLLEGRIPSDFPLTQGFPLNNMDQLFLTDRVRWNKGP